MIKNILLPTDFSELAGFAMNLADKIALQNGAKIHVLKVVELPSEVIVNKKEVLIGGMGDDLSIFDKEKLQAETKIEEWTNSLKAERIQKVKFGNLKDCLLKYIAENNIDLVVMGTHGVSGIKELVTGSITERIVLKSPVPVLSLKCDRHELEFNEILVEGSFEESQKVDLSTIRTIQKSDKSKTHLLFVNTKSDVLKPVVLAERMKSFSDKNGLENVEFHMVEANSREDGLKKFIEGFEQNNGKTLDLIALERVTKSTLNYFFTGCEATSVVNHLFKPILTYPSH